MQTTPCQNIHPMLGTCRTLEIEGVLIHWVSEGKGPLVLFVHGSQAWSYTWRYQINAFATAGYEAVAVDLPGNGYSAAPAHYDYSVSGNSRLIGAVMDAIDAPKAFLVASSAGGLPVLDFTIRNPEQVNGLILSSTCGVPHRLPFLWNLILYPMVGELAQLFMNEGMVRQNLREAFADPQKVTNDVVTAYTEPLLRPGNWGANLRTERSTDPKFVEQKLNEIHCPVLIVWGQQDAWHPVVMVNAFHQQLPQAELEILANCGHLPHEEQPECFNQRALEFINRKVK